MRLSDDRVFQLAVEFMKQNAGIITAAVLMNTLAYVIQSVVIPRLLAAIFNSMKEPDILKRNLVRFLVTFALEKMVLLIGLYLNSLISPRLVQFMNDKFSESVTHKFIATHKPIDVGIILSRVQGMVDGFQDVMRYAFQEFMPLAISLVVTLVSILSTNFKLGVLSTASIALLLALLYLLRRAGSSVPEADRVALAMEDTFNSMEFVTSAPCGIEQSRENILSRAKKLRQSSVRQTNARMGKKGVAYVLAIALYSLCLIYLLRLYLNGEVTVQQFEAHILVLGRLFEFATSLAYYIPDFLFHMRTLYDQSSFVRELFSHAARGGGDTVPTSGAVAFRDVSFTYPGAPQPVLRQFTATIPAGSLVALYGPSGVGKSTTVNLIDGVLVPTSGSVELGGINVARLSTRAIYSHIAAVRQNTATLMSGTIFDNMVYGLCDRDSPERRREVERLAREAHLVQLFGGDKDFLSLPVLKSGASLSGGQRQVVHLVRALLNADARIVLLDEPTSALDGATREIVFSLIRRLNGVGKTVIIITHDDWVRNQCRLSWRFSVGQNPVPEHKSATGPKQD